MHQKPLGFDPHAGGRERFASAIALRRNLSQHIGGADSQ
jgi:hypothetical protein